MDRLQERTTREETRRDEEGYPIAAEPLRCDSCWHACAELSPCTWDATLMVGACCAVHPEELEPACECRMDGGDLFDPRGCELHDSESPWNIRLRAVSSVQRYNESEVA